MLLITWVGPLCIVLLSMADLAVYRLVMKYCIHVIFI